MTVKPEKNTYFIKEVESKKEEYQKRDSGIIIAKNSMSGVAEWEIVEILEYPKYVTVEGKLYAGAPMIYKKGDKVFIQENAISERLIGGESYKFIEHRYIKGSIKE